MEKRLLDILVCPQCKGKLLMNDENSTLDCDKCQLRYAIKDEIPILLPEEAAKY